MTYGGRGRDWHPDFLDYMTQIVEHPNYRGIPAARDDDGKIDWTVPSNRTPGSKNWNGNELRRAWWRAKASELGIPDAGHWLRDTARAIHPFGSKPCQTCGRSMLLAYVYPTKNFRKRLETAFPEHPFEWDAWPSIFDLIDLVVEDLGEGRALTGFANAFRIEVPRALDALIAIVQTTFVDRDSRLLSPGAMSNAPDRLDGFHTYNLCCRSSQDRGRSTENLGRYIVDRRAYEHWSQGNWALADLMMQHMPIGLCRSPSPCIAKTHEVQLTADHIGPISLGFRHSAHFNGLCQSCNSAKNNRMSAEDVQRLIELEAAGEPVVSDHALVLWTDCAEQVGTDNDALLLSRLMRINQEVYLRTLAKVAASQVPIVLLPRLQLELAALRISRLVVDPETLELEDYESEVRQDTYESMRFGRIVRIAFGALDREEDRRNLHLVSAERLSGPLANLDDVLTRTAVPPALDQLNAWLIQLGEDSERLPLESSEYKATIAAAAKLAADVDSAINDVMVEAQAELSERFRAGDHRVGFS